MAPVNRWGYELHLGVADSNKHKQETIRIQAPKFQYRGISEKVQRIYKCGPESTDKPASKAGTQ